MDINLLFKIAAVGILVAASISKSGKRRSSNDDNTCWTCNCIINGYSTNKFII